MDASAAISGPGAHLAQVHLVDPALAAAALGAGPQQLRRDLDSLGTLFESAVVHDLTVFATALDAQVTHYRDSNGKEVDAIITLPDGRWGAIEVKLDEASIGRSFQFRCHHSQDRNSS